MKFRNAPQLIKRSDYEQAIDLYLERVSNIPGVSSVYTMGSIEAPGLSDIDLIIIVNDNFNHKLSSKLSVVGLDPRLFIHGPVIIPQSMTEDFQFIIYATNLRRLYGNIQLQDFSDLTVCSANILRFCYLIDFLESRQTQYTHALAVKEVDQRSWMARLWSLTHSEKLFIDSGLELQKNDQKILDSIKTLRSKWISENTFDTLLFQKTFYESIQLSKNLLMIALQELYSDNYSLHVKTKSVIGGNTKFSFTKKEKLCSYKITNLSLMGRKSVLFSARWNPIFAEHLKSYNLIKNNMFGNKKSTRLDVLRKRSMAVKNHWEWLASRCPNAGSMSGYLSFRIKPNNIVKNMLRTMLIRFYLRRSN